MKIVKDEKDVHINIDAQIKEANQKVDEIMNMNPFQQRMIIAEMMMRIKFQDLRLD